MRKASSTEQKVSIWSRLGTWLTLVVYQLALLYRFEHGLDLRVGLKAFLKAA